METIDLRSIFSNENIYYTNLFNIFAPDKSKFVSANAGGCLQSANNGDFGRSPEEPKPYIKLNNVWKNLF